MVLVGIYSKQINKSLSVLQTVERNNTKITLLQVGFLIHGSIIIISFFEERSNQSGVEPDSSPLLPVKV